jgi:hypothetical protein
VRRFVCPLLLAPLLACAPQPQSSDGGGEAPAATTDPTSGGIFLPTSTTGNDDESSSGTAGPMKLDLAPVSDLPPMIGCGAVDMLFVIDNSKSMASTRWPSPTPSRSSSTP